MHLSRFSTTALMSFIILLAGCSTGPESTVKGFYKALDESNVEKAGGYLSSRILQLFGNDKLELALGEFAARMASCGGLDTVQVELSGEGDTRQGRSRVSFQGQCEPEDNSVLLVKEEGGWKLGLGK